MEGPIMISLQFLTLLHTLLLSRYDMIWIRGRMGIQLDSRIPNIDEVINISYIQTGKGGGKIPAILAYLL
jgi:hypothetical protein